MEDIFRRHGLESQEKRSVVDAAWKERLRRDPGEQKRWQDAYWRFYAQWMKRGAAR
jgi:hypothetical protein